MATMEQTTSSVPQTITKLDDRFYHIDQKWYPRVTWILSYFPQGEGLKRWLGNAPSYEEAEEIKRKAGERGTIVHTAIVSMLDGMELHYDYYNDEQWRMLQSFVLWYENFKPEIINYEQTVVSKKHKYAGTYDLLCRIKGRLVLLDFKTSAAIYPSFWCQTAAYAQALTEPAKDPEIVTAILRLGSRHKSGFEYKEEERPWKESFKIFQAVKKIFESENSKLEPKIEEIPTTLKLNLTK